ncbi:MAG TPA: hypothetical protein VLA34_00520, partial [Candidatus Krumholzibacterium sp.]|nr:hypothetical protein [Candidatus Krumholzibacterium sp.]
LMILSSISCSEESEIEPFLGEEPPGMEAVLFAPGVVSTSDHEHSRIEFSPDGMDIYWAVIPVDTSRLTHHGAPFDVQGQKVWYSSGRDGDWSAPRPLPFDYTRICCPVMHPSGESLYFRATRTGPESPEGKSDIFRTSMAGDGTWKAPEVDAPGPLDPGGMAVRSISFCFSANRNLYFDVYNGDNDRPKWDIWFSEFRDGSYLEPVLLGGGINTGDVNWTPWVAPDESYILFSSHRDGNIGNGDIYVSFRDPDAGWSEPVNLGAKVNTESQERFPSVSPDGRYLFFARMVDSRTFSDIFWIDAGVIAEALDAD